MPLLLLVVTLVSFIVYFYGIGLWYLGLLPLVVCILLFWYYSSLLSPVLKKKDVWKLYGAHVGWLAILAGLVGIMHFFLVSHWIIALIMIAINVLALYISYALKYTDNTKIFRLGYYLSLGYMILQIVGYQDVVLWLDGFNLLVGLHLGMVAFLIFIVCYNQGIENHRSYSLFITTILAILLGIYQIFGESYIALLICGLTLGIIYMAMYLIWRKKPVTQEVKKNLTLRDILAGHKILHSQYIEKDISGRDRAYYFIKQMPRLSKYALEAMNIMIVGLAIVYFSQQFTQASSSQAQLFYWAIIILFTGNITLLKAMGFSSILQKFTLFAVINFAIYLTLFMVFSNNLVSIAGMGILRNILSSLILFRGPGSFLDKVLHTQDYYYWIAMTVGALILNVVLLSQTVLPGQLVFSFSFLYIGLQCMLLFYAIRHLESLSL